MGRKKIKIQPIKEDRNRSVTYLKRKSGLFKKAHELAVLTDAEVAVIVFGHNGKLAEFCSSDIDQLLLRYTDYNGVAERKGPQHYVGMDKDSGADYGGDDGGPDGDQPDGNGPGGGGAGDSGAGPGAGDGNGRAGPSGHGGSGSSGYNNNSDSNNNGKRAGPSRGPGSKRKASGQPSTSRSVQPEHKVAEAASATLASASGSGSSSIKDKGVDPSGASIPAVRKHALNAALRQRGRQKEDGAAGLALSHSMSEQSLNYPAHALPSQIPMDMTRSQQNAEAHSLAGPSQFGSMANSGNGLPLDMLGGHLSSSYSLDARPSVLSLPSAAASGPPASAPATDSQTGPSGRRSSFSAGAHTRPSGLSGRPMTANAVLAAPYPSDVPQSSAFMSLPSAEQQQQQHSVQQQQLHQQHLQQQQQQQLQPQQHRPYPIAHASGMPQGFTPSLAMQHQGHNEAVQAATASAAYAARGAASRALDVQLGGGGGASAHSQQQQQQQPAGSESMVRPSSTGNHRSHHSLASMDGFVGTAGIGPFAGTSDPSPGLVQMARPYTASGDFAAGSHLAPPGVGLQQQGFAASLSPGSSFHSYSASHVPSMHGTSAPINTNAIAMHEGNEKG